jgi:hypothetical protein
MLGSKAGHRWATARVAHLASLIGMADLHSRKREIDDALSATSAALKRARQQARDKERAETRAWRLADGLRRSVLIVYALTDYTALPAAKFLGAAGRKRHWPEKDEEELVALVEDLFLQVDESELAMLTDEDDPSDIGAMRGALPYVEEWRLKTWTEQLNREKGVAPSLASILAQAERQRLQLPDAVRPPAHGTNAEVRARVWAGAWRRRWGGRYGRLSFREDISLDEMRNKAVRTAQTRTHQG